MDDQSVAAGTLGTTKARTEFRTAHYDFIYQAAMGISGSCEMAEKLTEKLFVMMEDDFREKRVPYGVELYMLARLHRLYARESAAPVKRQPVVVEQIENAAPAPAAQPAPVKAAEAVWEEKGETAPQSASMPRRRRSSGKEEPLQLTVQNNNAMGVVPQGPMQPQGRPMQPQGLVQPQGTIQPQGPVQPMVIQLNGGMQSYYTSQPFLVQPLYPMAGAPAAVTQPVFSTPAEAPAFVPQPPPGQQAQPPAAAEKASYNPTLTEFWSPAVNGGKEDEPKQPPAQPQPTIQPQPAIQPQPPAAPAPAPKAQRAEAEPEQEDARMQRSVPLTIVNTFLFLGLLTAIAYLLMEIGLLPKLF